MSDLCGTEGLPPAYYAKVYLSKGDAWWWTDFGRAGLVASTQSIDHYLQRGTATRGTIHTMREGQRLKIYDRTSQHETRRKQHEGLLQRENGSR
jgi:hypothetical protein